MRRPWRPVPVPLAALEVRRVDRAGAASTAGGVRRPASPVIRVALVLLAER